MDYNRKLGEFKTARREAVEQTLEELSKRHAEIPVKVHYHLALAQRALLKELEIRLDNYKM